MNARRNIVVLAFFFVVASVLPADGEKVALVIGNGAYRTTTVSPLVNPPNDARDVSTALRRIGFEVRTVIDGTREEMGVALSEFGEDLQRAQVGLFFYAGHGVQVDGSNYLIPVDADLPNASLVPFRTIAADEILAFMNDAGTTLNMFFLDACRDNPLPQVSRSLNRGLAAAGVRPPETMIVYATGAGATADDGGGRNSPFSAAFLRHIATPGQDVYDLYRNIAADVSEATGGRQRPEQYGNVTVRYSLVAPRASAAGPATASVVEQEPEQVNDVDLPSFDTARVDGGRFDMGRRDQEEDEAPVHEVRLDSFIMMTTEVTFELYDAFCLATERECPPDRGWGRGDLPVIEVSWFDAVACANWLSTREGYTPAYTVEGDQVEWNRRADGWRLPTEAEWEYAARGGVRSGEGAYAGGNYVNGLAWFNGNAEGRTHPVGIKGANELGLLDMSGNVAEWCWDRYHRDYYDISARFNPGGSDYGSDRVRRGGSWYDRESFLRVTNRSFGQPATRNGTTGFRLVRNAAD